LRVANDQRTHRAAASLQLCLSSGASPAGAVGTNYSVQLAGSGGVPPYTWSVVSGSTLPAGLSLSTAGVLSGTPLATAGGTTNVAIQMKDSGAPISVSASQALGISIGASPAIVFSGAMPATAYNNQAWTGSAAASGGAGALTYTLNSGALPAGLSPNSAIGAVTGTISAAGTYSFTINAADPFGDSASKSYQIVASDPLINLTPAPGTLPFAVVGQAYSQTLTGAGGTGTG